MARSPTRPPAPASTARNDLNSVLLEGTVGITPVFVGEDNAHIETRFILSNTLRVNVVDGSPLLDPIFTHVKVTFVGTHPAIVRSARLRVVGSLRPDAHARLYVLAEHVEALHA